MHFLNFLIIDLRLSQISISNGLILLAQTISFSLELLILLEPFLWMVQQHLRNFQGLPVVAVGLWALIHYFKQLLLVLWVVIRHQVHQVGFFGVSLELVFQPRDLCFEIVQVCCKHVAFIVGWGVFAIIRESKLKCSFGGHFTLFEQRRPKSSIRLFPSWVSVIWASSITDSSLSISSAMLLSVSIILRLRRVVAESLGTILWVLQRDAQTTSWLIRGPMLPNRQGMLFVYDLWFIYWCWTASVLQ